MTVFNLIAYLLTDGGIDSQGRVYVASNSKAIIRDFKRQVTSAFGNQKFGFSKSRNAIQIRFSNNKIREELLSYSKSYRTRPCNVHPKCPKWRGNKSRSCNCNPITGVPDAIVPKEIILADKEVKKQFLMRVFTADGGTCLTFRKRKERNNRIEIRRMIVLRCDHPILLKAYCDMLSEFGIQFRVNGTQIQIERIESIRKFRDEINFLPRVNAERSKSWHKFEKRQLLEFMLDPSLLRPKVRS